MACSVCQSAEPPRKDPQSSEPSAWPPRAPHRHQLRTHGRGLWPGPSAWLEKPRDPATWSRSVEVSVRAGRAPKPCRARSGWRGTGRAALRGGLAAPGAPCQSDLLACQGCKVCDELGGRYASPGRTPRMPVVTSCETSGLSQELSPRRTAGACVGGAGLGPRLGTVPG